MIKKINQVMLKFGYGETNSVADVLAKMGSNMQCGEGKYFFIFWMLVLKTLLRLISNLMLAYLLKLVSESSPSIKVYLHV